MPLMFLLPLVLVLLVVGYVFFVRQRGQRLRALNQLLNEADSFEQVLREAREKSNEMKDLVNHVPEEMSASTKAWLSIDADIKRALKDLLAHRMWIKDEGANASKQQLDEAIRAMRSSKTKIEQQLNDLHRAGDSLKQVTADALAKAAKEPPSLRRGNMEAPDNQDSSST